MIIKKRTGFVVCFLLIFFVVACTSGNEETSQQTDEEREVTLSFWKAPHVSNEKEIWEEIIAEFEAQNEGIKVEFLETPWDGWDQRYTSAFAGSNPPDVSYMSEYFVKFAQNGQLADLEEYFPESERSKYSQSIIEYMTIDGKIYTMPFLAANSVVLYNKDIFEEEQVEIPQTWDELIEVAKRVSRDGRWGVYGLDTLNTIAWIGQAGGYLYADENRDVTKLGFNTPEGIAGLRYFTDLVLTHEVAPPPGTYASSEQADQAFYNGDIAMRFAQVGFISSIRTNAPDFPLGAFLNPAGPASDPAKQREAYGGLGTLAIAEKSEHKDEAWKFIQFVTNPENAGMYLEQANFLSPLPEANEDMYMGDEVMDVVKESIENLQVWPPNDRFGTVLDIVSNMTEASQRGVKTPEQAIEDAVLEYEN